MIARVSLLAVELDGGKAVKQLDGTVPIKELVPQYFRCRRKELEMMCDNQERRIMEAITS